MSAFRLQSLNQIVGSSWAYLHEFLRQLLRWPRTTRWFLRLNYGSSEQVLFQTEMGKPHDLAPWGS